MRAVGGLAALIVALGIGLFIYRSAFTGPGDVTQGTGNVRAAADMAGVKNDLLAMAQAERARLALSGSYASLDDLHSAGDLLIDPSRGRDGYRYSAEIGERNFTITASYSGPAAMPNFSINETMEISQR